ncbi:hypothetical protein Dimus_009804 [Dionaea muscipula]
MEQLGNSFSVLDLDAAADKDNQASPSSAPNSVVRERDGVLIAGKSAKKGGNSSDKLQVNVKNHDEKNSSVLAVSLRLPLVWIDLEMTGLNVEVDRILEIACIITDGKLIQSVEGPDIIIHQTQECLDQMGEWCQEHHGASGLTSAVLQSTVTEDEAENQVLEFVKANVGTQTPLLAGNSVYTDYLFLKKYMPKLASIFSHILVDVSTLKALCIRWYPKANKKAPPKDNKHRAMDDIKESIRELKFYKDNIFKLPCSKK